MPGAHVFPGGVLEESDSAVRSGSLTTSLTYHLHLQPRWNTVLPQKAHSLPDLNYRIGGIRELFEETGVRTKGVCLVSDLILTRSWSPSRS